MYPLASLMTEFGQREEAVCPRAREILFTERLGTQQHPQPSAGGEARVALPSAFVLCSAELMEKVTEAGLSLVDRGNRYNDNSGAPNDACA